MTTPPAPPEWSIHPDLLEEELAARDQAETPSPAPEPRRRSRARTSPPGDTDSGVAASTQPGDSGPQTPEPSADGEAPDAVASPPAWLEEWKAAETPEAAFAVLAKNLPKDQLEKDPTMQGWIGDVAQRRARAIQEQQRQEAAEAAKLDAARRGDLYQLGQLTAPELQQQLAAQQRNADPMMQQVIAFQQTLPPEVQAEIGGKTYDNFGAYIQATVEAATRHGRETYFDQTLKEREAALKKAWLSEANGDQQVPELEGGRASSIREITDEQLARMTLAETDAVLDEFGQPRPGIRLRLTRGIPLTRR